MNWLLSFITSPLLKWAGDTALDFYKSKLAATNAQDKLAVDLAIKEIEAERDARVEAGKVLLIENGRWWTAAPRAIVQWSFAIFVAKCVVYDKVLGLGTTDMLGGDIANWAGMVMAMWFGGRTLEKVTAKVAQIFKR